MFRYIYFAEILLLFAFCFAIVLHFSWYRIFLSRFLCFRMLLELWWVVTQFLMPVFAIVKYETADNLPCRSAQCRACIGLPLIISAFFKLYVCTSSICSCIIFLVPMFWSWNRYTTRFYFFLLTRLDITWNQHVLISASWFFFVVGRISTGNIFIYFEYYKLLISPYMNSNLYFTLCLFNPL